MYYPDVGREGPPSKARGSLRTPAVLGGHGRPGGRVSPIRGQTATFRPKQRFRLGHSRPGASGVSARAESSGASLGFGFS